MLYPQASGRARQWPSRSCRARRLRMTMGPTKASSRRSRCTAAAALLLWEEVARLSMCVSHYHADPGKSCKSRRPSTKASAFSSLAQHQRA